MNKTILGAAAILAGASGLSSTVQAQTASDPLVAAGPLMRLDAISVNATRTERLAIDTPESVTVLDLEEIEQIVPASVGDLLEDLPGVEMNGGPRSMDEQVSIRGLGGNRVLIKVDGARKSFDAGHRGRTFVDPEMLRRVEVVRGPGSTVHGAGALGGVVTFETKSATDFLGEGDTYGYRLRQGWMSGSDAWLHSYSAFGKYDDKMDGIATFSFKKSNDIGLSDDVTTRSINGTVRNAGRLPNSADDIYSALVKAEITALVDQKITLIYNRYRNEGNAFTTPDQTFFSATRDVERETLEDSFNVKYEFADEANPWLNPTVNLHLTNTEIGEDLVQGTRFEERDTLTMGIDAYNESYFSPADGIESILLIGVEMFQDRQAGTDNGAPDPNFPDATGRHGGIYVQAENDIGQALTLTAGLRFDYYEMELDSGALSQSDSSVSPKVGVTYRPADWLSLHALYSEAFRAPSLTELFVSGVHFAVPPFVTNVFVPNPNLEAEKGRSYETGIGLSFDGLALPQDKLRAKATLFRSYYDNFIQQNVATTTTTTSNVPDAHISGFEAEVEYATDLPYLRLGYHQYRGKNDTTNISLNDIPADTLSVDLGTRLPWINATVGGRVDFAQPQDRFGTETASAGYTVVDLYGTWQPGDMFGGKFSGFRLDAGVDNLFDKNYQRHLSNLPEEGVNYKMAVSYTASF